MEETALTIRMEFQSLADYWEPWLGGQGTVGAYVASLSEAKRGLIERHLRLAYLAGGDDGQRSFTATAWAARAVKPRAPSSEFLRTELIGHPDSGPLKG